MPTKCLDVSGDGRGMAWHPPAFPGDVQPFPVCSPLEECTVDDPHFGWDFLGMAPAVPQKREQEGNVSQGVPFENGRTHSLRGERVPVEFWNMVKYVDVLIVQWIFQVFTLVQVIEYLMIVQWIFQVSTLVQVIEYLNLLGINWKTSLCLWRLQFCEFLVAENSEEIKVLVYPKLRLNPASSL